MDELNEAHPSVEQELAALEGHEATTVEEQPEIAPLEGQESSVLQEPESAPLEVTESAALDMPESVPFEGQESAALVEPESSVLEEQQEENMPMDVDESFQNALDSVINAGTENVSEQQPTETVDTPMEENMELGTEQPEASAAETTVDNEDPHQTSPHAMEMHDIPEHDQSSHQDEADTSVAPSEKSMDASIHSSSAVDPFDAIKSTSVNESALDKDTSMSEATTNALEDDNDQDTATNDVPDINEELDASEVSHQENDNQEKEDDASQQKDVEEVPDDDVEEIGDGENENLSLLPDCEREISEADKEQARLRREESENEKIVEESVEEEVVEEPELEEPAVDITEGTDASVTTSGQIKEITEEPTEQQCAKCSETKLCSFSLISDDTTKYFCETDCVTKFIEEYPDNQYSVVYKKVYICYVLDKLNLCTQCKETKACQYRMKEKDEPAYFCDQNCVDAFIGTKTSKYIVRRKKYVAEENMSSEETTCNQCDESKVCKYIIQQEDEQIYVCEEDCLNLLVSEQSDRIRVKRRTVRVRELPKQPEADPEANKFTARTEEESEQARLDREQSFVRRCAQCFSDIQISQKSLYWETMDFCNEQCLGQYQNIIGSTCTTCHSAVPLTSLGKYCVRFGFEVRQFCRSECLNEFKKGLKVCSFCQRDIGADEPGYLSPIGEKGQFKDFCTQMCMKKYEEVITPINRRKTHNAICAVCNVEKPARIQLLLDHKEFNFCNNPCLSAFKFVNNVVTDPCAMCCKQFERRAPEAFTLYFNNADPMLFCTKTCMNIYITLNRKIVPCQWCKVKKYNFDMINKVMSDVMMCSLNCLTLCEVSVNAISMKRVKCDQCKTMKQPQYHLTMSDASIRNFCTYQCVMSFQNRFNKRPLTLENDSAPANTPVPTGLPKRVKKNLTYQPPPQEIASTNARQKRSTVPVITSVQSLAPKRNIRQSSKTNGPSSMEMPLMELRVNLEPLPQLPTERIHYMSPGDYRPTFVMPPPPPEPGIEKRTNIIVAPAPTPQIANKKIQTKPATETKAVSCRPAQSSVELQTSKQLERKRTIPIPVPVYVPTPVTMYTEDIPFPIPIPLPIPVPIFVPTSRNSANGILKEIKKIHDKMPSDPLEAELLMMADYVSGSKRDDDSESDSEDDVSGMYNNQNAFSEDLVQMALKMASNEYEENNVDLESAMTANTITHQPAQQVYEDPALLHHQQLLMIEQQRQIQQSGRGRKRGSTNRNTPSRTPAKKIKSEPEHIAQPEAPREPEIKPDANMCLKYTFGVNAWKQWVLTKNSEIEKSGTKRRPFKQEILQMTADELNYSLCLFVKEVRKPNGSEYAPDTIYYLVLGIQQYLYENGRIDNIFTDPYYERFTDCLDEVARKFSVLYNDSQYIVTRVEEEHLWECKQLGAHSPHVLLSTLMFFNTKHFNLVTVEEHMDLSFSHIMKHWKRNPGQGGHKNFQGSRNVMLRFYPPAASLAANARKKKVYEQSENEENPLRCPVKLYEFYLSKCPESVKTRNDVFYLQPERSCVPDSPVWYSTQPMSKDGISNQTRLPSQIHSRGASRTQTSFLQQFSLSRNYGDVPPRPQERPQGRLPPLPLITGVRSLATGAKKGKGKSYKGGIPCPEIRVLLDPLPALPSTRVVIGENGEYLPPRVPPPIIQYETKVVHMPREVKEMSNMSVQCNVITESQEVNVKPEQEDQSAQTTSDLEDIKTCIMPVPIYIPTPIRSFAIPRVVPKPFIVPIPIPIFIPLTKATANQVLKIINKHKKVDVAPADPYEAELLMMAEAVAGEKKSEDAAATTTTAAAAAAPATPAVEESSFDNPQFGEDLVQMALKMASSEYDMNSYGQQDYMMDGRGRKRPQLAPIKAPSKRIKSEPTHHVPQPEPPRQPTEKPDANMCLKYTFGVNAWKQWVITKNAELEKSSFRRKPFKQEILQMTADELNYSLCLFVKEVRKPNGSEYAPDTIYYLVLGIQQYLYENGRIDNIFTDIYYEKFTDCLDEVAKKFSVLYNDSQYIVTRVEEEHLWECKQLGAHSPHVLLSTLMFFNTKFFNLVTAEEHQDLSFSHIMKHWKRNPGQGGKGAGVNQGTRNVLLRYYPPAASLAANARKKKVYEQQENEENPLRCPVKLYEFYLSKCPESVKTRNDVFYLQPERSCVPDSPVWYSTQPLNRNSLSKMLHRVKMVKEINIALLTS